MKQTIILTNEILYNITLKVDIMWSLLMQNNWNDLSYSKKLPQCKKYISAMSYTAVTFEYRFLILMQYYCRIQIILNTVIT